MSLPEVRDIHGLIQIVSNPDVPLYRMVEPGVINIEGVTAPMFSYSHQAPSFAQVLFDRQYPYSLEGRTNLIRIKDDEKERFVTEKALLEDFIDRLNAHWGVNAVMKDGQMCGQIVDYVKPLCFIGKWEMDKAIDGIARRLLHYIGSGNKLLLYLPEGRSDRYVTQLVVDKIHQSDPSSIFTHQIEIHTDPEDLTRVYKQETSKGSKMKILLLDDYVISGGQGHEFVSKIAQTLFDNGIPLPDIQSTIEANYIASRLPDDFDEEYHVYRALVKANTEDVIFPYSVYSYYAAKPEPVSKDFKRKNGPIIGVHCLPDFSFINPVEHIISSFRRKMKITDGVAYPLLSAVVKPYETDPETGRYLDVELQKNWEEVIRSTGFR